MVHSQNEHGDRHRKDSDKKRDEPLVVFAQSFLQTGLSVNVKRVKLVRRNQCKGKLF